ncbi:PaaI family thioesterase [Ilumatobacter sp.]|uniref:PaaI family thioesterase n=1 Tax=Ilumatobacter sp. TaxID=1967498 RepID=UPI003B52728C
MPDRPDRPDSADAPTPLGVDEINEMIGREFPGSGNSCAEIGSDYAIARRPTASDSLRPGGFVSGPTQFALADAALWYVVFVATGRIEPMAMTSELSMRFLRPARGEVLWARATVEAAGRRNIVGTVHAWCDDGERKPTSIGQGTYVMPAPR